MEIIQETDPKITAIEEDEETTPIYGDILEAILSFIPLTNLIPICRVSKSWRRAVYSSLTNFNKPKPWLIIQTQNTRSFETKTTHAYDPRSNIWIAIHNPPIKHFSTLRSSNSNFVYVLSSFNLLLSEDPFNLTWRKISGLKFCRSNPIVALCGPHVIIAGSCWQFEDDLLAVEVYDRDSSTWRNCDSMPEILNEDWLSVAADDSEMFVTEKNSGLTYSLDPRAGAWRGPYDLRPDPQAFFTTVGFSGEDLIVVGLIGEAGKVERIGIWKVGRETMGCELIGEAPKGIVEKLKGSKEIVICSAKGIVYVYNPWEPEEVVFCEFGDWDWDCVWGSIRNVAWNVDVKIGGRLVFSCGEVGVEDLYEAMKSGDRKFL